MIWLGLLKNQHMVYSNWVVFVQNTVDPTRRRRALKNALTSKDLVLSHTVEGFVELSDLENEQILKRSVSTF